MSVSVVHVATDTSEGLSVTIMVQRHVAVLSLARPYPEDVPKDIRDALRAWLDSASDEETEEGPPEAYSCRCGGDPLHPRSERCGS